MIADYFYLWATRMTPARVAESATIVYMYTAVQSRSGILTCRRIFACQISRRLEEAIEPKRRAALAYVMFQMTPTDEEPQYIDGTSSCDTCRRQKERCEGGPPCWRCTRLNRFRPRPERMLELRHPQDNHDRVVGLRQLTVTSWSIPQTRHPVKVTGYGCHRWHIAWHGRSDYRSAGIFVIVFCEILAHWYKCSIQNSPCEQCNRSHLCQNDSGGDVIWEHLLEGQLSVCLRHLTMTSHWVQWASVIYFITKAVPTTELRIRICRQIAEITA